VAATVAAFYSWAPYIPLDEPGGHFVIQFWADVPYLHYVDLGAILYGVLIGDQTPGDGLNADGTNAGINFASDGLTSVNYFGGRVGIGPKFNKVWGYGGDIYDELYGVTRAYPDAVLEIDGDVIVHGTVYQNVVSASPSISVSASPSSTASTSKSESASPSAPSASRSPSISASKSITPSASKSASPSPSKSASQSITPSFSKSASVSSSPSGSKSASASASASAS